MRQYGKVVSVATNDECLNVEKFKHRWAELISSFKAMRNENDIHVAEKFG